MTIRKLHIKVGVILAPFFILLSLSGMTLLFRKTELYSKDVKSFLVSIHTWEIIAPFVGAFLGLGLLFLSISGLYMYFKMKRRLTLANNSQTELSKEYSNNDITVVWRPDLCVHAKECISRQPFVFNTDKKHWIDMSKASTKEIIDTIDACPSGALTYKKNKL